MDSLQAPFNSPMYRGSGISSFALDARLLVWSLHCVGPFYKPRALCNMCNIWPSMLLANLALKGHNLRPPANIKNVTKKLEAMDGVFLPGMGAKLAQFQEPIKPPTDLRIPHETP